MKGPCTHPTESQTRRTSNSSDLQDFEGNPHLKNLSIEFLEDIVCTPTLLPAEHKAASQLLRLSTSPPCSLSTSAPCWICWCRMLTKEEPAHNIINLEEILTPTAVKITIQTIIIIITIIIYWKVQTINIEIEISKQRDHVAQTTQPWLIIIDYNNSQSSPAEQGEHKYIVCSWNCGADDLFWPEDPFLY